MEASSEIALNIANAFNDKSVNIISAMVKGLTSMAIISGIVSKNLIRGVTAIGAGALGIGAKAGLKTVGKGVLARSGGALLGAGTPLGLIISIGLGISAIVDIVSAIRNNQENEQKEDDLPDPVETSTAFTARNFTSRMINNFYNNPQPAVEISREIELWNSRFMSETRW